MSKAEGNIEADNEGEALCELPNETDNKEPVNGIDENASKEDEQEEQKGDDSETNEKETSEDVDNSVPAKEEESTKAEESTTSPTPEAPQPLPPPTIQPPTSALPHKNEEDTDDETRFNSNPQVNIEDMKAAQHELNELDVLVCGACHGVFHFVEDFTRHKLQCKRKSNFHGNIAETKPQVWAFLLWKNAQTKVTRRGIPVEESSWKLYQKWCKMPERIRNAWVAAGETVMNFTTFGYGKPFDNNKFARKVEKGEITDNTYEEEKPVVMRKFVQRDHLGEIKEIRSSGIMKKKLKEDIENIRNQLEDGDSSQEKEPEGQEGGEMVLQEEEFVVEKIVSRRFNPRKKQYEYLIKWEGYPSEQNTWEPAENMEACQHLLKAFEESLTKQSIAKQSQNRGNAAVPSAVVTTTTNPSRKTDNTQAGPSGLNSFGRPVRYSKQKALNQVKAWCGSIKPDDVELDMKRKFGGTDSDEEDPATKRIKMELESDSEDSLMGGNFMYTKGGNSGIVKRGRGRVSQSKQQNTISNGTDSTDNLAAALGLESSGDEGDPNKTKSTLALLNQKSMVKKVSSLSPANQQVLVANAKGVVKIDPSQVPNLTSGVYIMSNKSGIIKLDSVSPSKALSMKQGTPVKQAPPSPKGGVIMLKNHGPGTQKSGIVRKNPGILKSGVTSRGPGRPPNPRPSGTIRIENPNTRILQSGIVARSQVNIGNRPKLPLLKNSPANTQRKPVEIEKRILGPKNNRGGIGRGGGVFRGRGGLSRTTIASLVSDEMENINNKGKDGKLLDSDSMLMDFPQDSNSSESEAGLPDDFPIGDLPPLEPESPPRPLTLCPLTGKVLAKAEGEKTPEPTPPPSPKPPTPDPVEKTKEEDKEEKPKLELESEKTKQEEQNPSNSPTSAYLNKLNNKDVILKKSFKPGSIGSVSISPKKILEADTKADESDMVTITGEDGLIYKVSNAELGNTLLVSGDDGQQCVYVTTGEDADDNTAVLTLDPSYADAIAQMSQGNILGGEGEGEAQFYVKEGGEDREIVSLQVQNEAGEDPQSQVVAQLVEAGEPAPGGGPRRVVLLLPDGSLMVTEVDEEQYAALELDKFQAGGGEIE